MPSTLLVGGSRGVESSRVSSHFVWIRVMYALDGEEKRDPGLQVPTKATLEA